MEKRMTESVASPLASALEEYVTARSEALAAARKELRVSELEARALAAIGATPGIRPSVLREHLGVTSAGVTTLVDRLLERDLLRRELDVDDRRVNHIYLTIDLETAPWSGLRRFAGLVEEAVRAEEDASAVELAAVLRRITGAAQARG